MLRPVKVAKATGMARQAFLHSSKLGNGSNRGRRPAGYSLARALLVLAMAWLLPACTTLPSSGPTRHVVQREAGRTDAELPFTIKPLATSDIEHLNQRRQWPDRSRLINLGAREAPTRTDVIRIGDSLTISIYEVGITLFSPQLGSASASTGTPSANERQLVMTVREDGTIDLPYIGSLPAAGIYPEDLANTIRARLSRMSQSPAVNVAITESVANAVYIQGAIARPGRYRLSTAREKLLDLVALAGGATVPRENARLKFVREGFVAELPLDEIRLEDLSNVTLEPGDRIEIINAPRTFAVFGANEKVSLIDFGTQTITLAEALAKAGGPSENRADPRGVFLFRLEQESPEGPMRPVVYEINMLEPKTYFLTSMVQMRDKDVIVFTQARSNVTGKLIAMLNQLFSPLFTGLAVSRSVR